MRKINQKELQIGDLVVMFNKKMDKYFRIPIDLGDLAMIHQENPNYSYEGISLVYNTEILKKNDFLKNNNKYLKEINMYLYFEYNHNSDQLKIMKEHTLVFAINNPYIHELQAIYNILMIKKLIV